MHQQHMWLPRHTHEQHDCTRRSIEA